MTELKEDILTEILDTPSEDWQELSERIHRLAIIDKIEMLKSIYKSSDSPMGITKALFQKLKDLEIKLKENGK